MTITKIPLSGSTNGKNIKIAATATPGTTLHTAQSGTSYYDEIFIFVCNTDTVDRKVTIEFGGTTSPDDTIEATIPAEGGLELVIPGLLLQNSLVVKAFGAAANVLEANGYVIRHSA